MLEIKCPYCGNRSQNEFAYGGDATVKRPELNSVISVSYTHLTLPTKA